MEDFDYKPPSHLEWDEHQSQNRFVVGVAAAKEWIKDVFTPAESMPEPPRRYTGGFDDLPWDHDDFRTTSDNYLDAVAGVNESLYRKKTRRIKAGIGAVVVASTLATAGAVSLRSNETTENSHSTALDEIFGVVDVGSDIGANLEEESGAVLPEESVSLVDLLDGLSSVQMQHDIDVEYVNPIMRENLHDSNQYFSESFEGARCESVEVSLPERPHFEAIIQGSEIEFGLSHEEYLEIEDRLMDASSKEEAQNVFTEVLNTYQIQVKYDDAQAGDGSPVLETEQYKEALATYLQALKYIPSEMLENVFTTKQLVISEKRLFSPIVFDAAGLYHSRTNTTTLNAHHAHEKVLVHEWAHALHDFVCSIDMADTVFEQEFESIMQLVRLEPGYPELKEVYDRALSGGEISTEQREEFDAMHKKHGLPSAYAGVEYREAFAEIAEEMLFDGYVSKETESVPGTSQRLQEIIYERMQATMPNVDVSAWLQYLNYYGQSSFNPEQISPKELQSAQISSLDATVEIELISGKSFRDIEGDIFKAIELNDPSSGQTEYIYGIRGTLDGRESIQIRTKTTGDSTVDANIETAVKNYLTTLSNQVGSSFQTSGDWSMTNSSSTESQQAGSVYGLYLES